jgi:hypothetical protein
MSCTSIANNHCSNGGHAPNVSVLQDFLKRAELGEFELHITYQCCQPTAPLLVSFHLLSCRTSSSVRSWANLSCTSHTNAVSQLPPCLSHFTCCPAGLPQACGAA